ncbi:MAG: flagellar basal body rod C-terminal domain-containing protein, partial [Planctomycetota bacterium]
LLHRVRFAADGSPLSPRGGRIAALLEGRDTIAPELRANLDSIAGALIGELNRLHTGGEGLARYTEVRALHAVGDRTAPLSGAGYPFPIEGGSFSLQVMNEGNDTRETYVLPIDLDGVGGDDTSLDDLVTWINSVVGAAHPEIQARVTIDGYLEIESTSSSLTFTFRDDDSGFLAAAGIHTLFEGASARDIEVNRNLIADPALLSTGRGGGAGDNSVVIDMLGLRDAALLPGGTTFEGYYTSVVGRIGVRGAEARDLLQNQEAITNHLENQRQALSGVNIDEEAISLIRYQRAYQGAARFLTVVDRLLETLINSV